MRSYGCKGNDNEAICQDIKYGKRLEFVGKDWSLTKYEIKLPLRRHRVGKVTALTSLL